MRSSRAGFNLIELVIVAAILGLSALLAVPRIMTSYSAFRVHLAAEELASTLRLSRMMAVRHNANVALKFRPQEDGRVTYTLYRDGDGDGVRNRDLETGIDPKMSPEKELAMMGRGVGFGFPPGIRPRDPGNPRRYLDRLNDPIRFNRSDLASFSSTGTSTPGSLYLTDGREALMVVRVLGLTGKVKILSYDPDLEVWKE
ncbi:MAG: GspH/FimT family pseudopilin [Acidobacteria bacterium]|nr:GspH/FimT family pseudopilin [Acidobacteriota bacterium]